jgi:hypothetical protein
MAKKAKFRVELTAKDMNYIWMSLIERIKRLEKGPLRNAGNIPHIRRYSKRVLNKIDAALCRKPLRWCGPRPRARRRKTK